jgi:glycosyltransferase involved in cell wall biosynthesis
MGQRVAMYVFNDVRTDARVLREAATLAAAGHEVTIVARHDDAATPARERQSGFEIVRIPVPLWPHAAWMFVRYPWRARRFAARLIARDGRALSVAAARALAGLAVLVMASIWSIVRLPIAFIARRLPTRRRGGGRQVDPADWLARWWWRVSPWADLAARAVPDATVHHGHDLSGLAAAVRAARRGGALIYDTHEIFLESGSNAEQPVWIRRRWARLEQAWLSTAVAVVTVNEAIAAELRRRYRTPRIVVVHNCPPRPAPSTMTMPRRLRDALGLGDDTPIALYHGAFSRYRGLEQLVEAIRQPGLETVHAAFLGYGALRGSLDELAAAPGLSGRVHVLPPVPPDQVIDWVAGADVAVMAIQPSTLNHVLSTPNKLFEALAAGVPVVASDFPAIREIVLGNPPGTTRSAGDGLVGSDLGVLCDPTDPEAIARGIARMLALSPADRAALRARCRGAAESRWNWERESAALVDLYAGLG